MGTTYSVKFFEALGRNQAKALADVFPSTLTRIDALMSTYKPDSELSRFNQHDATSPFPVSDETLAVFKRALEVSRQTDGAFDITVGPIVNAYGFGPDGPTTPPDDDVLAELRKRVGYQQIELDEAEKTVRKKIPNLYCDLSAIAKGCAVDQVALALSAIGIKNYMVEVGGEVRAAGVNDRGTPWRIGIEQPTPGQRGVQRVLPLENMSLATSGDYRNYREVDGVRISHTIDPRTGRPVQHNLVSVSVLHAECAYADAYATALTVLGPEEGFAFAAEQRLTALFIFREADGAFTEKWTPGLPTTDGAHP